MTKKQMAGYKAVLEAKLQDIGVDLKGLKEGVRTTQCPDAADQTCFSQIRDTSALHADMACRCERQILNALRRIEEGTFGTCLQCEEPIDQKRLKAVPWAALCINCQEQEENGNHGTMIVFVI